MKRPLDPDAMLSVKDEVVGGPTTVARAQAVTRDDSVASTQSDSPSDSLDGGGAATQDSYTIVEAEFSEAVAAQHIVAGASGVGEGSTGPTIGVGVGEGPHGGDVTDGLKYKVASLLCCHKAQIAALKEAHIEQRPFLEVTGMTRADIIKDERSDLFKLMYLHRDQLYDLLGEIPPPRS